MGLIQNFKNITWQAQNIPSPVLEDVYECPADTKSILIGCDVSNISNTGVTVTVSVYDASKSQSFSLVTNAPIAVGATLQIINKQKHVFEPGDKLEVTPGQGNASISLVGACMEVYTE